MSVFHFLKIVQVVQNRDMHHNFGNVSRRVTCKFARRYQEKNSKDVSDLILASWILSALFSEKRDRKTVCFVIFTIY